jgi:hypothetical protein
MLKHCWISPLSTCMLFYVGYLIFLLPMQPENRSANRWNYSPNHIQIQICEGKVFFNVFILFLRIFLRHSFRHHISLRLLSSLLLDVHPHPVIHATIYTDKRWSGLPRFRKRSFGYLIYGWNLLCQIVLGWMGSSTVKTQVHDNTGSDLRKKNII